MMSYLTDEEWETTVSEFIKGDLLWKMEVYRLALFLGDLAWNEVSQLSLLTCLVKCHSQYATEED